MSRVERAEHAAETRAAHMQDFIAAFEQGGEKACHSLLMKKKADKPQETHVFLRAFESVMRSARHVHTVAPAKVA